MPTIKEVTIDCTTGETLEISHEISQEEWDRQQAQAAAEEAARTEAIATANALKQSARAKLIAGLPLTEEEASSIVL